MVSFTKTLLGASVIFCVLGLTLNIGPFLYAKEKTAPTPAAESGRGIREAILEQLRNKRDANNVKIEANTEVKDAAGKGTGKTSKGQNPNPTKVAGLKKTNNLIAEAADMIKKGSLNDAFSKWDWTVTLADWNEDIKSVVDNANDASKKRTGKSIDEWKAAWDKMKKENDAKKPPKTDKDLEEEFGATVAEEIKRIAKEEEEKRKKAETSGQVMERQRQKNPAQEGRNMERER